MKPILAKELRKKINNYDPKVDEFITKECEPSFMQGNSKIRVSVRRLIPYDIEVSYLINQLQLRGFIALYQCEDRPCGECWVEITIPVGDE